MDAIFQRITRNNFSELPGLAVDASLPLPEPLVNELIEAGLKGNKNLEYCRVSIGSENRLTVNLKTPLWPWTFHLKLKLFHAVDLSGSPKVRAFLENNVLLGRLGVVLNALPPGIAIYEDQVSVDIGALVNLEEQKRILELIKSVEIRTEPGRIIFDAKIRN
jgi:hypothetical protein